MDFIPCFAGKKSPSLVRTELCLASLLDDQWVPAAEATHKRQGPPLLKSVESGVYIHDSARPVAVNLL